MTKITYTIITIAIIFLPCWYIALVYIDNYNQLMLVDFGIDSIQSSESSVVSEEIITVDEPNGDIAFSTLNATITEMLDWVIMCESSGKHDNVWGSAGEYGILQYKQDSFYWLADKYNFIGDWKNKYDQIDLFLLTSEQDKYQHWTCFRNYQNNN